MFDHIYQGSYVKVLRTTQLLKHDTLPQIFREAGISIVRLPIGLSPQDFAQFRIDNDRQAGQ